MYLWQMHPKRYFSQALGTFGIEKKVLEAQRRIWTKMLVTQWFILTGSDMDIVFWLMSCSYRRGYVEVSSTFCNTYQFVTARTLILKWFSYAGF